jgi:DNA segregation ATPase FtsK/SpoIIIE, S-DNA-T family
LDQTFGKLVSRGLGYGIHVVLSANRWMDVRPAVRDMVGSRLELRLGEPFESEINRRAAANVPENTPGRGVTKESLHFLCGLPRIDDRPRTEDLNRATAGLVAAVRQRTTGEAARVRTLPRQIPLASLPPSTPDGMPIGLDEDALAPVLLNFDAEPHLLILGEAESGRTNLLKVITHGVVSRFTPMEARILLIDYRRTMLDAVPASHLIGYAASPDALRQMVHDVGEAMRARLPGPNLTTDELRNRSWWSGARLFILVDDYDLVESAQGSPLAPLADLLAQGGDIGLHFVAAREVGGAGRAMFEAVLRRVREIGCPGLQLSGNPDEGAIFGKIRPQPMPPGRGVLVSRRLGTRTIQVALAPDDQAAALERAGLP